jgi:hypothetical protein
MRKKSKERNKNERTRKKGGRERKIKIQRKATRK